MIKAVLRQSDALPAMLLVGLSHANLDRLRRDGLKGFIKIEGKSVGLPVDVMITAGETEAVMADALAQFIGPDTKVIVDDKLKS